MAKKEKKKNTTFFQRCVWSVVTSELHGSQVSAGRHRSQNALRQTLGLLGRVAATRPVRPPRVSLVAVTATFEASCGHDTHDWEEGQPVHCIFLLYTMLSSVTLDKPV